MKRKTESHEISEADHLEPHFRKEEELKRLKTIINSSSNGVIIVDTKGEITSINNTAAELLEVSCGRSGCQYVWELIPEPTLKRNILGGFEAVYKIKWMQGEKPLVYDFIPFGIDHAIDGATILIQDVSSFESIFTEIKLNAEIIERLDSIVEYSYDGIYITDGKANTLRINEAYERITGLKRSDMLHRNMKDLVLEGYISESGSLQAIDEKRTISLNQTFKTGKKALITSKPIFDEVGEIVIVVTNVRDITELYHLKVKLEEQEKLVEKYYNETKRLKMQLTDVERVICEDKRMLDLHHSVQRIAATDFTVMLTGESGVGKEVMAKFVHQNSQRVNNPFIKVNCGAIPENLIESELFGYEKGAFSGARVEGKSGLFESAHRGTLFLDEIGELPLNMQVKLLRVLQEGEFTRVGGVNPKKVDVRIISATNRNLEEMVKTKQFREDLYYRLNVIPVLIPPLRERKQDIIAFIRHFLQHVNAKYGWDKLISRDALDVLYDYAWPGNIRELKNVIERVVAMSKSDLITCDDLPAKIMLDNKSNQLRIGTELMPLKEAVTKVEKALLDKAYEQYGNVREAAKALEIDPSTFVRKRQKYE